MFRPYPFGMGLSTLPGLPGVTAWTLVHAMAEGAEVSSREAGAERSVPHTGQVTWIRLTIMQRRTTIGCRSVLKAEQMCPTPGGRIGSGGWE